MAQIDVEGTIYWESGLPVERSGRLEDAIVKYKSAAVSGSVTTDDDGDFKITGVADSEELSLVLLHENAQPKKVTKKVGEFSEHLNLRVQPIEGKVSQSVGGWTLAIFSAVLAVLVLTYFSTHQSYSKGAALKHTGLINVLKSLATTAGDATEEVLNKGLSEVRDARNVVDNLRFSIEGDLAETLDKIVAYKKSPDAENIDDLVEMVRGTISRLMKQKNRFFWTNWPWIMVEAWAWGLLGVLLTKIVRIGWYLRTSSYIANGTWMHVSHVVATPFLALIAVLALSFLKLESEEQTILSLSNPLVLQITACFLSANPWGLWDFILSRSDAILERAKAAS